MFLLNLDLKLYTRYELFTSTLLAAHGLWRVFGNANEAISLFRLILKSSE